jgi:hypothetical protein
MKKDPKTKRMSTILFICLIIMLIGSIFQVQHYPGGKLLLYCGISLYIILSLLELERLRKIVGELSKDETK